MKDVDIAAVCDGGIFGRKRPARYLDLREMLDKKDIDCIYIATLSTCGTADRGRVHARSRPEDWFWDDGNGDFSNQGVHELDIARWGLGVKYPTKVSAIGGDSIFDDDQQTPNTLNVAYEFNEGGKRKVMVFEVRHWDSNHEGGIGGADGGSNLHTVGNHFYGSKGYLAIDGHHKYSTWLGQESEDKGRRTKAGPAKKKAEARTTSVTRRPTRC